MSLVHKALIVDDSLAMRLIMAKILAGFNIQNVQAENGLVACQCLEKIPDITIAFVDWNMPVMTGIQFVRHVRANPAYHDIKIVMVTTETELPQIMTALEAGVNEYIMKPFTKEIFFEKLALLGIEEEKT